MVLASLTKREKNWIMKKKKKKSSGPEQSALEQKGASASSTNAQRRGGDRGGGAVFLIAADGEMRPELYCGCQREKGVRSIANYFRQKKRGGHLLNRSQKKKTLRAVLFMIRGKAGRPRR